ncbi:DoxX family protein [Streptomyces sp. CBMA152]|nr:DoxX family protein [Streptomyces sp. CBMA152]
MRALLREPSVSAELTYRQNRGEGTADGLDLAHRCREAVRSGFTTVVQPRPRTMAYVVVYAELALGVGSVVGLPTPIALIGALLLNHLHPILMIHDWAEQGRNAMMALISLVALIAMSWQTWSLDHTIGLF